MSMAVSDEAIKAAMELFYRYGYSNFAEAERAFAEAQTRAALEAAAPHMLAAAWDAGRESIALALLKPLNENGTRDAAPNPYRTAK